MNYTMVATALPQSSTQARDVQREVEAAVRQAAREAQQAARQAAREAEQAVREARAAQAATEQGLPAPPVPPQPPTPWTGQSPWDNSNVIPPQAVDIISIMGITLVLCVIGFPLARAFARWIDRRGTVQPVPRELTGRLEAIEQAVESIAVEVERISEGQRFTTRLLTERAHEPLPAFASTDRDPVPLAASPVNARRS